MTRFGVLDLAALDAHWAEEEKPQLFQQKDFQSHSGLHLTWKIECDALTAGDWQTLACIVSQTVKFRHVHGVPQGGIPFANALRQYESNDTSHPVLIVDDVLTSGKSMIDARNALAQQYREGTSFIGVVVFARPNKIPPMWVEALFQMKVPTGRIGSWPDGSLQF